MWCGMSDNMGVSKWWWSPKKKCICKEEKAKDAPWWYSKLKNILKIVSAFLSQISLELGVKFPSKLWKLKEICIKIALKKSSSRGLNSTGNFLPHISTTA